MNKSTNTKNINNFKSQNLDWNLVQNEMKIKLGLDVYESWLRKITFVDEFNNYLLLSVPTRFIRDWITSRYLDQILQIIRLYKKDIIRIEFKIDDKSIDHRMEGRNGNRVEEAAAMNDDSAKEPHIIKKKISSNDFFNQVLANEISAQSRNWQLGTYHSKVPPKAPRVNYDDHVVENKGAWNCFKCGHQNQFNHPHCQKCRSMKRMGQ